MYEETLDESSEQQIFTISSRDIEILDSPIEEHFIIDNGEILRIIK
jgi:hypothetical protein